MLVDARRWLGLLALGAVLAGGCDDDDAPPVDAAIDARPEAGAPADGREAGIPDARPEAPAAEAGGEAGPDGSADAGEAGGGGDGGDGPSAQCPALPAVWSLSGCSGVGPLCTVKQTGCGFTANCAGTLYTGTVDAGGVYRMAAPPVTANDGTRTTTSCLGELVRGRISGQCSVERLAMGAVVPTTSTCSLAFDRTILPSVACMEVPSTLQNVSICTEGAAAMGTTLSASSCKVVQDGCNFQAECEGGFTVAGTASKTGLTFTQSFKALADAAPAMAGGTPPFLKGALVNHACTATVEGTNLTGTCGAGRANRTSPHTSSCSLRAAFTAPPTCAPLVMGSERVMALDSCDILKNGEGGVPGIGEPVCAYRQNNCNWEVQCGRTLKFAGRLTPGATKFDWTLDSGTPCEGGFNAAGDFTGKCTVPGQAACPLASKVPVPGGASCATLPAGTQFYTHGCGGPETACRQVIQHGCNFLAMCSFGTGYPDVIFAGAASRTGTGRNRLSFNGLSTYQCQVDEALPAEIASMDRRAGEWYGTCTSATGGVCRDNYDPATGAGFRGLRLYFGPKPPPAMP